GLGWSTGSSHSSFRGEGGLSGRNAFRNSFFGIRLRVRVEETEGVQPAYAELRPARGKLPVLADAKVMLALRENVQLHGYASPLQSKVHDHALVRWAHRVVRCVA